MVHVCPYLCAHISSSATLTRRPAVQDVTITVRPAGALTKVNSRPRVLTLQ